MRSLKFWALTASAAAILVACGGGSSDGDQAPKVGITSVKVIGDSLTDSGAFIDMPERGRIFSVQGNDHKIWTELVAQSYGVSSLCNFYKATGETNTGETTFINNSASGCTSFGVGRARINNATNNVTSPMSLRVQLAASLTANGGTYKSTDLVLIDGGGNDVADMIGSYLLYLAGINSKLQGLFLTLNSPNAPLVTTSKETVDSSIISYMKALADLHFDTVKANALDKGATHVAILNIPAVTKTPRLKELMEKNVPEKDRAASEAQFRSWINAFNTQLAARAAGNASVVVVDMNSEMEDQVANPAQYGLTNSTTPACPTIKDSSGKDVPDSSGLKTYDLKTCTAEFLSKNPPAGVTDPNWWKTYIFSDNFHPTPAAYKLLAQLVNRSLIAKGWL